MHLMIEVPREVAAVLTAEAAIHGENLQTLIEKMLRERALSRLTAKVAASDSEFESDMIIFAEDASSIQTYSGSYSRADIYSDHD